MSTRINTAIVAAVITLAAAPQLASAQQGIFLPSTQWNTDHRQPLNVPSDARASAGRVTQHRAYDSTGSYQVRAPARRPANNNLNPDFQLGGDN
jgi:hypothetical protein